MTTEIVVSNHLSSLIKQASESVGDFYSTWLEIKEVGKSEGFSEQELEQMVLNEIRNNLKSRGLEGKKLYNKMFYLKNQDMFKEKNAKAYEKRLINQSNDYNNDIEQSSSTEDADWDRDSAIDEISDLRNKLNEANDTIKSLSFNDNADIFQMNKNTEASNERYFEGISAMEAMTLLKSFVKSSSQRIAIGWRLLPSE